ncbi:MULTISPECIES: tryptophan synthase subunit alpha [unclassified Viridibacillus]|uniref:tryptophan synthase subunit alpha n=1 Tax=unclassified Viridibacillus TaxID=2617942 RepID=UPI00096D3787|nr:MULTISPECIES: tryptophan synthase subunit alpha [unclassified Viridibacillus]OMC84775.1 tryptophan synthase subunit alpha [Viridibacillus sp. FSL H8-0123]OMC85881.1 tryptophan synthase subunit alpha [Viridibacillus sp. FSL H7-0596]
MAIKTLQKVMEAKIAQGEKAFVAYIMAGDGGLDSLREQILFLQDSGVTAIELGIPFTDPVADGPVIQEAGLRALEAGANLRNILKTITKFKDEIHTPLVVMSYLNPIIAYGIQDFTKACEQSGVSGLIIPDLPLEESTIITSELQDTDIALIQLVSLTSPQKRIIKIAKAAEGFIYAVTVNGTTGVRQEFTEQLEQYLANLKKVSQVPVLAGFGISNSQQVKEIGAMADGVIVGSAIVQAFHDGNNKQITELLNKQSV